MGLTRLKLIVVMLLVSTKVVANPFEIDCLKTAIANGKLTSYFGGFCYSLNPTEMDWARALESCNDLANGRLAFLTDQQQLQFIDFEFDIKNGIWNGVAKSSCQSNDTCDSSQEWLYVNGLLKSIMRQNLWAVGQPNTTAGDAGILSQQGYKVANSTQQYAILCQYPEPQDTSSFVQRGRDAKGQPSAVSKTLSAKSQHQCGILCNREPSTQCASYGYSSQTGACTFYWLPFEQLSLAPAAGFIILDRKIAKPEAYSCPVLSNSTYDKMVYYGRVPNGGNAQVICPDGMRAGDASLLTCVAPYWTPPTPPECKPGYYIAADNFNLTSASAVCTSHVWLPPVPLCRRVQEWTLVTKTAAGADARGATGTIYLTINGTLGTSRKITPTNGETNYQSEALDTFGLRTQVLGTVNDMVVGNSGGDGWWAEWIHLHDMTNEQTYNFTCNSFYIDGNDLQAANHIQNVRLVPD